MNSRKVRLGILIAGLVIAGVVVTFFVTRSGQEDILLQSAGSVGPDPFTTTAAVAETTTSSTATTVLSTGTTTKPGLYGGTGQKRCDPGALIAFLMAHSDKAAAWVAALNTDNTVRWGPNGMNTTLTVADIPTYIHELIPTHLLLDTRVTNWGFVNGHGKPFQALLQAGTPVFVDKAGTPRAKCECGNPNTQPHKVSNAHYVGVCWPGCHACHDPLVTTTIETRPTTTTVLTTTTCVDTEFGIECGTARTTTTRKKTSGTTTTQPKDTTTSLQVDTTIPVETRPTTTTRGPTGPN